MFDLLGNPLLALALVLPRVIGAFLMLPLMTQQTVPPMVRNSFMVSLAIIALPVALAGLPMENLGTIEWPLIVLKEVFIGVAIGFCSGIGSGRWRGGRVIETRWACRWRRSSTRSRAPGTLHGRVPVAVRDLAVHGQRRVLVFLDLLMGSYVAVAGGELFPSLPGVGMKLFGASSTS